MKIKTTQYFILLNLIEFGFILAILYGLKELVNWIFPFPPEITMIESYGLTFVAIVVAVVLITLAISILHGLFKFAAWNWNMARRLSRGRSI